MFSVTSKLAASSTLRSSVAAKQLSWRTFSRLSQQNLRPTLHPVCRQPLPLAVRSSAFSSSSRSKAKYARFTSDPQHPLDVSKWDRPMKIFAVFIGGSAVYYFVHLEQVPETGRWRFMDINPKFETRLAQEAQAELVREFHGKVLPPNHPLTRHVRRVVTRILDSNNLGHLKDTEAPFLASQANRDSNGTEGGDHPDDWVISGLRRGEEVAPGAGGREWNLMVVNDDKVVNAMATYGNVIVFTGILPVCKDEQGLAAVLGHEIGHVVARHASENYSRMKILLFVATLLNIAGLDFGFSRLLTKLLVDLPNSRLMETEADKIGLRLSAKACYDPRAAPEVFTRMGQLEKAQGRINLDFLYTHPASSKRVEALNEMLHEAYAIQAATPECGQTTSYMEAFRDVFGSVKSPISSGAEWRFN